MFFTHYNGNPKPMLFGLTRDDSGSFRVYRTQDGTAYKSVTSFIGEVSSGKEELQKWRDAVGIEEANHISKVAADKGTAIHLAMEHLVSNQPYKIDFFYQQDYQTLKKIAEKKISEVFAIEHQMYSDKLMLAGTADLIAKYDGQWSIIDYKTSSRVKYKQDIDSYFNQLACYAVMMFERYGMQINQLVIMMVVEGDPKMLEFIEPAVPWMKNIIKLRNESSFRNGSNKEMSTC